uniref:Uncharacterized protein n=1 Tax=Romanomermis culicivorax TaxID=13658 RepID=A0A915K8Q2_ROMCU
MVDNADSMSNLLSLLEQEAASEGDVSATIKKLHDWVLSSTADELNKYITGEANPKDQETSLYAEDILNQVLKSVPADVFFEKFPTQILFGLNSDSTVVKYKFLQV